MAQPRKAGFGVPKEWKDVQEICRRILQSRDDISETGKETSYLEDRLRFLTTPHYDSKGKLSNDRTMASLLQSMIEAGFAPDDAQSPAKAGKFLGIVVVSQIPRPDRSKKAIDVTPKKLGPQAVPAARNLTEAEKDEEALARMRGRASGE